MITEIKEKREKGSWYLQNKYINQTKNNYKSNQ